MVVSCQILINKPTSYHRPGQPVNGVIKYALNHPLEVYSVVLSLVGEGECSWTETESNGDKSESKTYYGTERFFKESMNVVKKTGGVVTIPAGSYEVQFEFCFPKNIPPTFQNHTATISYKLLLKFKRPGLFQSNKKFSAEIPIRTWMESEPETPLVFGLEKKLTKLFSRKKPLINLKVMIAKTTLTPGETAHLDIVVTNNSNVTITAIKSEILRNITYTADCGQKEYDDSVIQSSIIQSTSIPGKSIVNLTQEMPVSSVIYTVRNSRILKVEFKLRVTLRLPMPHINASTEVPVLIIDKSDEYLGDEPPSYWQVMCEDEKGK
ncbi:arrestin domain-containing protein 17-like [Manduca sexta]|uniref:arrestin domain-containing protein 17-like n=1 Tax=Manduca sexta TaxID=7130 RepID=UPI0018906186|nr:arrestin domain-containing protein 17-like [Manduca sexta]